MCTIKGEEEKLNINQKNSDIVGLHLQVIFCAAIAGGFLPVLFLLYNIADFLHITPFIVLGFFFLIGINFFLSVLQRYLTLKFVRVWLYLFGIILLVLTAVLVINTGGIQSSIFNWLFEYALIVALLVRVRVRGNNKFELEDKWMRWSFLKRLLSQWRPVIIIFLFEIVIISIASFKNPIIIPDTIPIVVWARLSIFFALCGTIVTWVISEETIHQREYIGG